MKLTKTASCLTDFWHLPRTIGCVSILAGYDTCNVEVVQSEQPDVFENDEILLSSSSTLRAVRVSLSWTKIMQCSKTFYKVAPPSVPGGSPGPDGGLVA